MQNPFNPESGIMKALSFVGDLVVLNLVFIVCCLPVVTIGAATTGLNRVMLKKVMGQDEGSLKPFFRTFRSSFRRATVMWLVFLTAVGLGWLGFRTIRANPDALPWFFGLGYSVIAALIGVTSVWVWPLEAQFDNTVPGTLKNALRLGIGYPLMSIVMLALWLAPVLLFLFGTYWFLITSVVWFLFGFSGIAALNALLVKKKFMPFIGE